MGDIPEKQMEDAVARCPDHFIENNLQLVRRQVVINGRRPDIVFKDGPERHLLVELQRGRLDEDHLQRPVFSFYDYWAKYRGGRVSLDLVERTSSLFSEADRTRESGGEPKTVQTRAGPTFLREVESVIPSNWFIILALSSSGEEGASARWSQESSTGGHLVCRKNCEMQQCRDWCLNFAKNVPGGL